MENYCVICGDVIPEGRMACPNCEKKVDKNYQKDREFEQLIKGGITKWAQKKSNRNSESR